MNRKGILAAGNWIIDIVKIIDVWPNQDSLANILSESSSNGGSPYNVLKNLAKMKVNFPLEALGLVGDDNRGNEILADCHKHEINIHLLTTSNEKPTSYTDVMTVHDNGRRTFFHNRGANALLDSVHFNFDQSNAKIFHLGYLMLLDKLDELTEDKTTKAAQVFKKAKEGGFITSTDIVSENTGRFKEVVSASLPFIDYLFINEYEASKVSGIDIVSNRIINKEKAIEACKILLQMGVNQWVILHYPEGVIAISKTGEQVYQSCLTIPTSKIKGTVGAGDAFASGVLYGIHESWSIKDSLELGVCTAAACLFNPTCSGGILSWQECLNLKSYGFTS